LAAPEGTLALFNPSTASPTKSLQNEPRFQSSGKNPTIVILAVIISGITLLGALLFSLKKKE